MEMIRKIKRKIVLWIYQCVESEIKLLHQQHEELLTKVETIERRWAALQAMDINFRETSKIIICARTNRGDRVEIIEMENMTIQKLKEITEAIKDKYGAKPVLFDCPYGTRRMFDDF